MQTEIPEKFDPIRLARQGVSITGSLDLLRMTRLAEHAYMSAVQGKPVVDVTLVFEQDPQHFSHIKGHIQGELTLICQRCLHGLQQPFDLHCDLIPVKSEAELDDLPDGLEGCVLDMDKKVSALQVVEDEILLWLPLVVLHPEGECIV